MSRNFDIILRLNPIEFLYTSSHPDLIVTKDTFFYVVFLEKLLCL